MSSYHYKTQSIVKNKQKKCVIDNTLGETEAAEADEDMAEMQSRLAMLRS